MRPNLTLAALAAALLLFAPGASAGWLSNDPVTVEVPPLRVGDRILLSRAYTPPSQAPPGAEEPTSADQVFLVEGKRQVADRFGILRQTDVFLMETEEGSSFSSLRCHRLEGGREAVRVDLVGGEASGGSWTTGDGILGLSGSQTHMVNSTPIAWFSGACEGPTLLGGRTFREGDRVPAGLVLGFDPGDPDADALSGPGEATTFHGRPALRFTLDPRILDDESDVGSIEFVLADGLPAIARLHATGRGDHAGFTFTQTLAGIERGAGLPLAPYAGATLPDRNPSGRWHEPDARGFDDEGYGFSFRYAEAYEGLVQDPRSGFADWLKRHPGAVLAGASYARERDADSQALRSEGVWTLTFRDGEREFIGIAQKLEGNPPLAGTPPRVPLLVAASGQERVNDGPWQAWTPDALAHSHAVARAAEGAGVSMGNVVWLRYEAFAMGEHRYAQFALSTTMPTDERADGHDVIVDGLSGGLFALYATSVRTTREGGLLAPPSGPLEGPRASALSVLAGPGVGSGLAVGGAAATGLAILLVLLKLVAVPLFTRLRRDRLLDNPVRARLYERVRAEPGIHLAGLAEYLGVGKGATRHHVDQLVRHRLLVETQDEGFTRYFCAGEVPPEAARREMVLRAGATRQVYDLLAAEPGLSLREAAARLGMSAPTVHRYKKRLEKAGLLPAAPAATVTTRA